MKKDLSKFLNFKPYKAKKGEDYMCSSQINHFKTILLEWKNLLMKEADKTVEHMKKDSTKLSDPNDAATQEEEFRLELRTRDRERSRNSTQRSDGSYRHSNQRIYCGAPG